VGLQIVLMCFLLLCCLLGMPCSARAVYVQSATCDAWRLLHGWLFFCFMQSVVDHRH
jgi:hypothetical protein